VRVPTDDNSDEAQPWDPADAGESVAEAAADPQQASDARGTHNAEHVGIGYDDSCYFCEQQQPGFPNPVIVPWDPPLLVTEPDINQPG
jgi:hypothetical protein